MKQCFSLLLSLAMACCLAMPAFADEDLTPAPTSGPDTSTVSTANEDGVYVVGYTVTTPAGGEVATVNWGDRINVVVQVVDHSSARYGIKPEEIAARVNSSVFTYTGTGEIGQFFMSNDDPDAARVQWVKDGGTAAEVLAAHHYYDYYSYVLLFRDVIYNGGGNTFPVNLTYLDTSKQMQTFSVEIGQCVDEDPEDPSKAKTPNLVVRDSSYGTEIVTAGNPFMLDLGVYATSGTEELNDVIVSLTLPEGVSMTGGSLSTYVGSMGPQSNRQVSFSILPNASFTGGVANIGVALTGTGAVSGSAVSGNTTISVPISQPDRFELGQLEVQDMIYLGDMASVTLNFVNKGKNPVANLEASLTGQNIGPGGTQYLGNLAAGTENSVDFDLTPEQAGPMSGVITLTYESENGEIKTVSKEFSGTVEELIFDDPGMMDPGMMEPMDEPKSGLPIWGWALIALAVAGAAGGGVFVVKKRKKAKALKELENEDDDEIL